MSSWDKRVYLYQTGKEGTLVFKHETSAPVLDCGWLDSRHAIFPTLDAALEIIDVTSGRRVSRTEKIHDGCVRKVESYKIQSIIYKFH